MDKNKKALAAARKEKAAKLRGEQGYNPSGTQGAKGTEGKFMNPKMYGDKIMPRKKTKQKTLFGKVINYKPTPYV